MIDPKKQAEFDQGAMAMAEVYSSLWWGLFTKLVNKGFSANVALDLLKVYITTAYQPVVTDANQEPPKDDEDESP